MALLLCKIIPGHETFVFSVLLDYIFLLSCSEIYSYVCFLMQIIEITRTLTLLFILLHLNADATMRLEGLTLLLWAELLPVS